MNQTKDTNCSVCGLALVTRELRLVGNAAFVRSTQCPFWDNDQHRGTEEGSCPSCEGPYRHCGDNHAAPEPIKATEAELLARLRHPRSRIGGAHDCCHQKDRDEAADEIERLRDFRNRMVGFFNELYEDAKDEHGCRVPYMLFGDDSDVVERFEKALGKEANG